MEIDSIPSRNQINKLITNNLLISEEEFNEIYEQLYLEKDFWSIGLAVFDTLIDIEYDDEEEKKHWRTIFAGKFDDDFRLGDGTVLEIGAVKRQVRKTLRALLTDMRAE